MKLTDIRICNFKCHADLSVKTPRILLLTGANSSGKSSLINALLAVAQSPDYPFAFSPNGELVTMGDYAEIVHNHDIDIPITLEFGIAQSDSNMVRIKSEYRVNKRTGAPLLASAELKDARIQFSVKRERGCYVAKYEVDKALIADLRKHTELDKALKVFLAKVQKVATREGRNPGVFKIPDFGKKTQASGSFLFRDTTQLKKQIETMLISPFLWQGLFAAEKFFGQEFSYMSPFRVPPERTYYRKTKDDLTVDKFGVNAIEQLVEWRRKKSKMFRETVEALKNLELLEKIEVQNLKGGRFEIRVTVHSGSVSASLMDVGFGISQFLPVLIADLQLEAGGLFVVSQPEIHLHPKTQALYAAYIGNRAKNYRRQYIVETHSEYIINRIRLMVAKGELAEEDVALYYLERKGNCAAPCEIQIKKNGELVGAPESFFDTYMMDTMQIALESSATQ